MQVKASEVKIVINQLESLPVEKRNAEDTKLLASLQAIDLKKDTIIIPKEYSDNFAMHNANAISSFLSPPSENADVKGALDMYSKMESLILLMSSMSRMLRELNLQKSLDAFNASIKDLNAAADMKIDGAQALKSKAQTAFIISLVASATSIIGNAVALGKLSSGAKAGIDLQLLTTQASTISQLYGGVSQAINAGAALVNAEGQAQNQEAQAKSDKMQAQASEKQRDDKAFQDLESFYNELINKLTNLLQALYDAKNKNMDAAAKA